MASRASYVTVRRGRDLVHINSETLAKQFLSDTAFAASREAPASDNCIGTVHKEALNVVERHTGQRHQGLAQASRTLGRTVPPAIRKQLRSLGEAFNFQRHLTDLGQEQFIKQLVGALEDGHHSSHHASAPVEDHPLLHPEVDSAEVSSQEGDSSIPLDEFYSVTTATTSTQTTVTLPDPDAICAVQIHMAASWESHTVTQTEAQNPLGCNNHKEPDLSSPERTRGDGGVDSDDGDHTLSLSSFDSQRSYDDVIKAGNATTSGPVNVAPEEVLPAPIQRGNFATAHHLDLETGDPADLHDPVHISEPRPPTAPLTPHTHSALSSPRALALESGADALSPPPSQTIEADTDDETPFTQGAQLHQPDLPPSPSRWVAENDVSTSSTPLPLDPTNPVIALIDSASPTTTFAEHGDRSPTHIGAVDGAPTVEGESCMSSRGDSGTVSTHHILDAATRSLMQPCDFGITDNPSLNLLIGITLDLRAWRALQARYLRAWRTLMARDTSTRRHRTRRRG